MSGSTEYAPYTHYTPEVAAEICTRLAGRESLRRICEDEHMPNASTVHGWVLEDKEGFAALYTRARQIQAMSIADEIIDISDNRNEDPRRSRLMVDTRKWFLAKMLPKVYGDKLTLGGDPDHPLEVRVTRTIIRPDGDDS